MLAQLQSSGATGAQMGEALAAMQNSMKAAKDGYIVEDSVDVLVKKLESQGKKVKIIEEDEEDEETPDGVKQKKKRAKKQVPEEEIEDLDEEEEDDYQSPKKKQGKPLNPWKQGAKLKKAGGAPSKRPKKQADEQEDLGEDNEMGEELEDTADAFSKRMQMEDKLSELEELARQKEAIN
jgi:hypothetical protein